MSTHASSTERSPLLSHSNGKDNSTSPDQGLAHIEPTPEQDEPADEAQNTPFTDKPNATKQLRWIVFAVGIGVFLAAADQTIIVSSYGKIGSDLDSLNLTSWIATAYLLSLTSFQPLYGKLSDIFGRKPCLIFAYFVFGLGGLLCGFAQSMAQLIAARFVQGIGGGGMSVVVSIILSDVVPLKDRGLWQGVINIVYSAGAASGGPLGGFCADVIGWRWTFFIQVPMSVLAILAVVFALNLQTQPSEDTWRSKMHRVDFAGAFVLVLSVFLFLFGMDRGANNSWTDPISYGPLAGCLFSFALFIYIELRVASEPFAPGRVVFPRTMFATYACYFFSLAATMSILYYLPLYFQAVTAVSATGAGLRLIPSVITGVLGSLLGGAIMRATDKFRTLTIAAYAVFPLGVVLLFLCSGVLVQSLAGVLAGSAVITLANGSAITSALIALIAHADPADQAIATALSYLFRGLGSTVGIALSSTLIQSVLRSRLQADLGSGKEAEEIERRVRRSLDYLDQLDPETRAVVRRAYGVAVRHSYVLVFGLSLCAFLCSFFIREKRLSSARRDG